MELTGERKCPHLTWAERENAVMGRRKNIETENCGVDGEIERR